MGCGVGGVLDVDVGFLGLLVCGVVCYLGCCVCSEDVST